MTYTLQYDEIDGLNFDGIQKRLRRIWAGMSRWARWLLEKAGLGWNNLKALIKKYWDDDDFRGSCVKMLLILVGAMFSVPLEATAMVVVVEFLQNRQRRQYSF